MSEVNQETPAVEEVAPVVVEAPVAEAEVATAPQETASEEAVAQVVQVLREITSRRGATKRFDVVAVADSPQAALDGLKAGEYTILNGSTVQRVAVSYRTVQDVIAL